MKKIKKEYVVASLLIICFIILTMLVINDKSLVFDSAIYNLIIGFKSDDLTKVLKVFTTLGNEVFSVIILLILFFIFLKKKKLSLYKYIVINSLIGVLLMLIIKYIIRRPRPDFKWIVQGGFSYPSGHTIMAFLLYGTLSLIVSKKIKGGIKYLINFLLLVITLLIAVSRIYFGAHYLTDVIASIILAVVILVIANTYIKDEANDKNKIKK